MKALILMVATGVMLMACGSGLDSVSQVYDATIMRGEAESQCAVVDEALDHITGTEAYQAEGVKWDVAMEEIEAEYSGLVARVQAMREEILTGDYPYLTTVQLWQAARRACVEERLLEERS